MTSATTHRAILFADVAGSSRLYETLGDAAALALVERSLALARAGTERLGGRVVKSIGDEIMAGFASAEDAVCAAIEMQQRVCDEPTRGSALPALRIGVHSGAVIEDAGDLFGDTVNTAARVVSLAKAAQILTTVQVLVALPAALQARTRPQGTAAAPGKREEIPLFEVLWQESRDDATVIVTRAPLSNARLKLICGAREFLLGADQPSATLGRDPASDIVVMSPKASRVHGRIERRRDKFVLIDQSSNGTWVSQEGSAEVLVRREELVLRGRGRMSFGEPQASASEWVTFSCES